MFPCKLIASLKNIDTNRKKYEVRLNPTSLGCYCQQIVFVALEKLTKLSQLLPCLHILKNGTIVYYISVFKTIHQQWQLIEHTLI